MTDGTGDIPRRGLLVSSTSRGIQCIDDTVRVDDSSNHIARSARAAERGRDPDEKLKTSVRMKDPPVHHVEVTATLDAVEHENVPETAAVPVLHAIVGHARHLAAAHARVEDRVRLSPDALAELDRNEYGSSNAALREVRAAAQQFLEHSSHVVLENPHAPRSSARSAASEPVARRLLPRDEAGSDASPLTLFDTSPTSLGNQPLRYDVPPEHDRDTVSYTDDHTTADQFESGAASPDEGEDVVQYLECMEALRDEDTKRRTGARCLLDFTRVLRKQPEVLSDVLEVLHPQALVQVQEEYAHAAPALLAAASAIGSPDAQEVMCTLLLSIDYSTPEVKSYVEAHDFFYTVQAIGELTDPTPATFDAMHESLIQHQDHQDQYHQLLLALGGLARQLTRDHPIQQRVLSTLHGRFDKVVSNNKVVEARFHEHVSGAKAEMARMGMEERHMWLARMNHVDRREWAETWATATDAERSMYEAVTVEAIARILAENHGEDNGYGVKADYTQPTVWLTDDGKPDRTGSRTRGQRRLLPKHEGHNAALGDLLTVQATDLRYAIQALSNLGHPESASRILRLTQHARIPIRAAAVHALHSIPTRETRRVLMEVLQDPLEDAGLRVGAADAMGEYPQDLLDEGGSVVDAALSVLADGGNWESCELECTEGCDTRFPLTCQRQCVKRCKEFKDLDVAVVALLESRWGHSPVSVTDEDDQEAHARRLADLRPHDGDDHYRLRGARRLYELLAVLEGILAQFKIEVVRTGVV